MNEAFEKIWIQARSGNVEDAARSYVNLTKEGVKYDEALEICKAIRQKHYGVRLRRQRERSKRETSTTPRPSVARMGAKALARRKVGIVHALPKTDTDDA